MEGNFGGGRGGRHTLPEKRLRRVKKKAEQLSDSIYFTGFYFASQASAYGD